MDLREHKKKGLLMKRVPAGIPSTWLGAKFGRLPSVTVFLLAALSFAPSAGAQFNGTVRGRVTDSRGEPMSLLVHLLAEGDLPVGDVYTDSNGSYLFSALPSGTYYVVVEADGFKPFRQSAMLDLQVQPNVTVEVLLEALPEQKARPGPFIVGSTSSHELNSKRPLPPFNPKAVREYEKGNKERQKGNAEGAMAHYQKALRIDANFYPALNNVGLFLSGARITPRQKSPFAGCQNQSG